MGRQVDVKNLSEYGFVIALLIGGFTLYHWSFTQAPVMPGIDGPYYLIQVRSILETGVLTHDDPPLTFYLFALFSKLVGDVYDGVIIGVSFLASLSALPIYLLMRKVTGRKLPAIASIIFFLYSAYHVRLVADLMKNAVGILFLAGFIYYLHDIAFKGRSKRNITLCITLLTLTTLTHILDLGVAILFLTLYTVLIPLLQRRKEFLASAGIRWASIFTVVLLGILITPYYFTDVGKGMDFVEDLVQPTQAPQQGPPRPIPGGQAPQRRLPHPILGDQMWWAIPFLVAGAVLSVKELIEGNRQKATVLIVATTVGILLILPFIPHLWLWRFTLMEFIPLSMILGVMLSRVKEKMMIIILSLFILTPISIQAVRAVDSLPPSISEVAYRDLETMKSMIPPDSIIVVPHKGVAYWVEYLLRTETTGSLSPDLVTNYRNIFTLAGPRMRVPLPPQSQPIYRGEELILFKVTGALPEPRQR
ncbi:MAG: glycosyltransferase family 39 protein [Nitrososphaerales archaeon]